MTEDEVRKVVAFVRSHQPNWKRHNVGEDFKRSLYNRRLELSKDNSEYQKDEDEFYVREFMKNV